MLGGHLTDHGQTRHHLTSRGQCGIATRRYNGTRILPSRAAKQIQQPKVHRSCALKNYVTAATGTRTSAPLVQQNPGRIYPAEVLDSYGSGDPEEEEETKEKDEDGSR
jgi:hypothetical protein